MLNVKDSVKITSAQRILWALQWYGSEAQLSHLDQFLRGDVWHYRIHVHKLPFPRCHWTSSLGRSKHPHRVNIGIKNIWHMSLSFGSDVPMCHCEMHLDGSTLEYLIILTGLYQPPMHVEHLEVVDMVSFLHWCQGCLRAVIISRPPNSGITTGWVGQICDSCWGCHYNYENQGADRGREGSDPNCVVQAVPHYGSICIHGLPFTRADNTICSHQHHFPAIRYSWLVQPRAGHHNL